MKMTMLMGIALAAVALFIMPVALAQNEGLGRDDAECPCPQSMGAGAGMMHHCPDMHMMSGMSPAGWIVGMCDRLNLTDNQIKQLSEQDVQFKTKMVDRKAAIAKKKIQLKQAIANESASKDQIKGMLDDVAKSYVEIATAWLDAKDQAKQVLTPEQQGMLKSMRYGAMPCPMPMREMKGRPEAAPKGAEK